MFTEEDYKKLVGTTWRWSKKLIDKEQVDCFYRVFCVTSYSYDKVHGGMLFGWKVCCFTDGTVHHPAYHKDAEVRSADNPELEHGPWPENRYPQEQVSNPGGEITAEFDPLVEDKGQYELGDWPYKAADLNDPSWDC